MKKLITVFFVLTSLLLWANPTSAYGQYTINMPPGNFELTQYSTHTLNFEWKLPKHLGGDTYEGETIYEMCKWVDANYPFITFKNWTISRMDDEYTYGYCQFSFDSCEETTLTITGIINGPITIEVGGNC